MGDGVAEAPLPRSTVRTIGWWPRTPAACGCPSGGRGSSWGGGQGVGGGAQVLLFQEERLTLADVSLGERVGQRKGPNLAFAFQTLLSAKQITVIIPFAYFAQ